MVTIVIADGTQPEPATNGMVEVRGPGGDVLGRYKLTTPDLLEVEMGVSLEEIDRRRSDPNTVWYTAGQLAARLRELRCSP